MLDNFVSMEFILSFAGMVIVVGLLTQFTKSLVDTLGANRTKYVVYGWSFFLCVLAAFFTGNFSTHEAVVETLIIWLINSIVVWFTAMKGYEEIFQKDDDANV